MGAIEGAIKIVGQGEDLSAIPIGDRLILDDSGNQSDSNALVKGDRISGLGSPSIVYRDFENVSLLTGSGNDQVTVLGTPSAVDFSIDTASGEDHVIVRRAQSQGPTGDSKLSIHTGDGNDRLSVRSANEETRASANLGDGDDHAVVGLPNEPLEIGSLDISGGDQGSLTKETQVTANGQVVSTTTSIGDKITVFANTIAAKTWVELDRNEIIASDVSHLSDESLLALDIFRRNARHLPNTFIRQWRVGFSSFEEVKLETGSQKDFIEIMDTHIGEDISIETHGGDDYVWVRRSSRGTVLDIHTGDGNDSVKVDKIGTESILKVSTESGDDQVVLVANGFDTGQHISLGEGDDELKVMETLNGSVSNFLLGDGDDRATIGADFVLPLRGLPSTWGAEKMVLRGI